MYKHLLLATDGSDAAGRAVKHSLGLVNAVGPNVTVLTVKPPWPALAFGVVQGLPSREDYEAAAAEPAEKNLGAGGAGSADFDAA